MDPPGRRWNLIGDDPSGSGGRWTQARCRGGRSGVNLPWGRRGEGHQRAFVLGLLRLGKCFPAPAWSDAHDKGGAETTGLGSRDGAGAGALGSGSGSGASQGNRPTQELFPVRVAHAQRQKRSLLPAEFVVRAGLRHVVRAGLLLRTRRGGGPRWRRGLLAGASLDAPHHARKDLVVSWGWGRVEGAAGIA
jgi:hypothetical protein